MKTPSDVFLTLLPASQRDRAKAYLAAVGGTAAAVMPLIPHVPEGVGVFIAVLTGLGVFAQSNAQTPRQRAIADAVAASTPALEEAVEVTREAVSRVKSGAPLVEVAAEVLPRAVVSAEAASEAVRRAVDAAFNAPAAAAPAAAALPVVAPIVLGAPAPGATEVMAVAAVQEAARQGESAPVVPARALRVSQYRSSS